MLKGKNHTGIDIPSLREILESKAVGEEPSTPYINPLPNPAVKSVPEPIPDEIDPKATVTAKVAGVALNILGENAVTSSSKDTPPGDRPPVASDRLVSTPP